MAVQPRHAAVESRADANNRTGGERNRLPSGGGSRADAHDTHRPPPGPHLRDLAEDLARRYGSRPALSSQRESFTYDEWNGRANQYARWMRDRGYGKGDVIALLMPNRPEYLSVWLGFAKMGGVTALLNTNLPGAALAHCIRIVAARAVIVDASLLPLIDTACEMLPASLEIFVHGDSGHVESADRPRVDLMLQGFSKANIPAGELPPLTIEDRCLYIYTSGTTGMPKAANINHYRVQLAMLRLRRRDRTRERATACTTACRCTIRSAASARPARRCWTAARW